MQVQETDQVVMVQEEREEDVKWRGLRQSERRDGRSGRGGSWLR